MAHTEHTAIRLASGIRRHVEKLADKERRSLSQMLRILIEEALARRNGKRLRG